MIILSTLSEVSVSSPLGHYMRLTLFRRNSTATPNYHLLASLFLSSAAVVIASLPSRLTPAVLHTRRAASIRTPQKKKKHNEE